MDEPVGHGSAGDVGDQLPAPLHGNMLEDDQVNRQARSRGPIDSAESGTPAGRPRHVPGRRRTSPRAGRAAPAPPARPGSPPADTTGNPQVSGIRQVRLARYDWDGAQGTGVVRSSASVCPCTTNRSARWNQRSNSPSRPLSARVKGWPSDGRPGCIW